MAADDTIATRASLLDRLKDHADDASWQEFFDTYWRLIYSVARRAGLNDAEAQEVVQETVISVARRLGVSLASVCLATHRVATRLKREIQRLEIKPVRNGRLGDAPPSWSRRAGQKKKTPALRLASFPRGGEEAIRQIP
jgi:hypothetical protein